MSNEVTPVSVPPFSPRDDAITIKELRNQTPFMRGLYAAIGYQSMRALGIDINRVLDRSLTASVMVDPHNTGSGAASIIVEWTEFLFDVDGKKIFLDGRTSDERLATRHVRRELLMSELLVIANDDRDLIEDAVLEESGSDDD